MHVCIRDVTSVNTSQMLSRRLLDDGQCDACTSSSLNPVSCPLGSFAWSCQKPTSRETGKTLSVSMSDTFEGTNHYFKMFLWSGRAESTPTVWESVGLCIKINDAVEFYLSAMNRGDLKVMRCCVQMHPAAFMMPCIEPCKAWHVKN